MHSPGSIGASLSHSDCSENNYMPFGPSCTHGLHVHVHNSCRAAWALQLICWKYRDLCTEVM